MPTLKPRPTFKAMFKQLNEINSVGKKKGEPNEDAYLIELKKVQKRMNQYIEQAQNLLSKHEKEIVPLMQPQLQVSEKITPQSSTTGSSKQK